MRQLPWGLATVVATSAVLAAGILMILSVPPSYLHPDEQSAAMPARTIAGLSSPLPEDLRPFAPHFRPYKTAQYDTETGVSTGLFSVGGVGFAYPLLLSPFYMTGHEQAPYLLGPIALALLYVGALLVLNPRRPTSYALAGLVLAAPPVLLQVTVLFSNMPGLAFAVLGVGLIAEAFRGGRGAVAAAGILALAVAAAVRIDYLITFVLMLPLGLAMLLAQSQHRLWLTLHWIGAILLCGGAAAAIFWALNGSPGLPYLHPPGTTETNAASMQAAFERARLAWDWVERQSSVQVAQVVAQDYIFGFVPALIGIGLLYAWRPGRRENVAWLLLPLMLQGVVVWAFTGRLLHYGTGCACVDGSQPRYFLPIYASLALLGALFVRDALTRLPRKLNRTAMAFGITALILVPGIAHAHEGEQGIDWANERRAWHRSYDQAAMQLPEDAVVVGNYLSKIVLSRPVLVPNATSNVPRVMANLTQLGRPLFVGEPWLNPGVDEGHLYGIQMLGSGSHYLVHSGLLDLYEIKTTNATIRHVFNLTKEDWADNGTVLTATDDPAFFRAVDGRGGGLPLHGMTRSEGRVTIVWLDDVPNRTIRAGYHNFDSDSTVERASWNGTGSGQWVETEFTVPENVLITGAFYVTGEPTVRRLEVVWS